MRKDDKFNNRNLTSNMNDKAKFFNKWSIICLIGNLIQIFGSVLATLDYQEINTSSELLIGFGCMFAYCCLYLIWHPPGADFCH